MGFPPNTGASGHAAAWMGKLSFTASMERVDIGEQPSHRVLLLIFCRLSVPESYLSPTTN